MGVMVCIPANRELARELLVNGSSEQLAAFAPTQQLYQTFDLAPNQDEDAEFAATLIASVTALTQFGERVVLVAEVTGYVTNPATEENGGVFIPGVRPNQIAAWFVDETPEVAQKAAKAATGMSIDEAWEVAEVAELLANHDLCWHDPSEAI